MRSSTMQTLRRIGARRLWTSGKHQEARRVWAAAVARAPGLAPSAEGDDGDASCHDAPIGYSDGRDRSEALVSPTAVTLRRVGIERFLLRHWPEPHPRNLGGAAQSWEVRRPQLQARERFALKGRVAVAAGGEGFNARSAGWAPGWQADAYVA